MIYKKRFLTLNSLACYIRDQPLQPAQNIAVDRIEIPLAKSNKHNCNMKAEIRNDNEKKQK